MYRPIRFGHVIAKNFTVETENIGDGVDYIRKIRHTSGWDSVMKMDYAYIVNGEFEGVIDTLNIVGKKSKISVLILTGHPTIGKFSSVSGDGTSVEFTQGSTVTISNTLSFASSSCSVDDT